MARGQVKTAPKNLGAIIKTLRELREQIRSKFKAEVVGIFGSYARGEQREGSDLDLLVHFLEGASLFDLVELGEFLEEKLGLKVDIVSDRAIRRELKDDILREMVRI